MNLSGERTFQGREEKVKKLSNVEILGAFLIDNVDNVGALMNKLKLEGLPLY